ncbi:MAG: sigma-70 family RNA polymerase sigma factor [Hespellia sp.]|nr:sigma-70 family RNA polymerase sigma factor [Hespellia sp.]
MNERKSYDEIYRNYNNFVYRVAFQILGDKHLADDIMQDVFLKLLTVFEETDQGGIASWLHSTTSHMAFNYLKKAKREILKETIFDDYGNMGMVKSIDEEYVMGQRDEEFHRLHTSIMQEMMDKNPKWYDAFHMCYTLKVPQSEVAAEMEITVDSLKGMLKRTKNWMRKCYGVEYKEIDEKF